MTDFLKDLRQSLPWWLMLILQIVQYVLNYLLPNSF